MNPESIVSNTQLLEPITNLVFFVGCYQKKDDSE